MNRHCALARTLSLAALLGLGLAARYLWMAHAPFPDHYWMDERFSAALASQPMDKLLQFCRQDVHPPLYFIALKFWNVADLVISHRNISQYHNQLIDYHLLGIGRDGYFTVVDPTGTRRQTSGLYPADWAQWPLAPLAWLRLLSVLCALAMALLIERLGRILWPEKTLPAWVAMALILFSPYMLSWDTVIRSYSMQALMLAALAMVLARPPKRIFVLFSIVSLLTASMLLTGYLLLLTLPCLLLVHILLHRRMKESAWIAAAMGVGLLFFALLWGRAFLAQSALRQVSETPPAAFLSRLAAEATRMAGVYWQMLFSYGVTANLNPFDNPAGYAVAFVLYAACLGAAVYRLIKQPCAADAAIFILALGPPALAVAANALRPESIPCMARYFYPFAPFYFLLLANGLNFLLQLFLRVPRSCIKKESSDGKTGDRHGGTNIQSRICASKPPSQSPFFLLLTRTLRPKP